MKMAMKDGNDDVDDEDDEDEDEDEDIYAVAFCHSHNNLLILLNNKCNYVPRRQRHVGALSRGGRGTEEGTANSEINLDTKPGRHCGLKPRHTASSPACCLLPAASCVVSPPSRVLRPCMLSDSQKFAF